MEFQLKPYRGPSFRYKIRKVTSNNKTGDSYGINIPRVVATLFENVQFNIFIAGSDIVLSSGCKPLVSKEVDYNNTVV